MLALLTQLSPEQLKTQHKMTTTCLTGEHRPQHRLGRGGSLFQAPGEELRGDILALLTAPCAQHLQRCSWELFGGQVAE